MTKEEAQKKFDSWVGVYNSTMKQYDHMQENPADFDQMNQIRDQHMRAYREMAALERQYGDFDHSKIAG